MLLVNRTKSLLQPAEVPDFAKTVVTFLLFDFCANVRGAVVPPVVSGMVLDGRKSAN